jgi:ACT domain-containing protein
MIRTIVTVIGVDKVGIIARASSLLAQHQVNILDINQTVMQEYFTMVMMVDIAQCNVPFEELKQNLMKLGQDMGMTIHVQHEEIFQSMHRI